jgi:aryl-alcohol dehydrogenase-like predicted oxidoreductase
MAYCIDNSISILAYAPIAQELLTGKFGPAHNFQKGDHRSKNKLFQPENYRRAQQALSRLRPIADQLAVNLGQLALAWVASRPGVCAIAGARNAQQATMNARSADISLTADTLAQIDRIGRWVTDYLDENPVMWLT